MKKEFEFTVTHPISRTKHWAGQIKISGRYNIENGGIIVDIDSVHHTGAFNPMDIDWSYIPHTFWTWLENGSDRIGEIAYEHCKGLMPEPDMSHVVQTKGGLS